MPTDTFTTPLDIDQCHQRISAVLRRRQRTLREWLFGRRDFVRGWGKGDQYYIYLRPRPRNLAIPVYRVTLVATAAGTEVQGKVLFPRASVLATAAIVLGCILLIPVGVDFFGATSFDFREAVLHHWEVVFFSVIMFIYGFPVLGLGVFFYRNEGRILQKYIRRLLKDPVPGSEATRMWDAEDDSVLP